MNNIIDQKYPTLVDRLILLSIFGASILICVFFIYGIYAARWSIPAKKARIVELSQQVETWRARVKVLEKYTIEQDKKYRVATKCSNLFWLIADSNQIMDFEALDEFIQDKKDFHERVK